MRLSRRGLLGALPALGLGSALWPTPSRAAEGRKLLVVFAFGGWDTVYCFAPSMDPAHIDVDPDGVDAEAGGIPFVDNAFRPSVRSFFESWGSRACVLNGLEVHSVAHHTCRMELITGHLHTTNPDWLTRIAADTGSDLTLPLLHFSGPLQPGELSGLVVRVGSDGQLDRLLGGAALTESGLVVPGSAVSSLEDAYVAQRRAERLAAAGVGREQDLASAAVDAHARGEELRLASAELALGDASTPGEQMLVVAEALASGRARCGIVQHDGYQGFGWDTHGGNNTQSDNFEQLFSDLNDTLAALDASGALDDTTVVVCSELGRYPRLNSRDGKEHWTFTSAMLIGSGIAGGQVIGAYDGLLEGRPVDLSSGAVHDTGEVLTPGHLGATLLSLADVDPEPWFPTTAPIDAALS